MSEKRPNPIDVHVGKRIKMRRVMLNISQTDLGEKSAITFQQVQKYEKGTNRVSASRLAEFSQVLDIPVSFFFEGLASNGAGSRNAAEDLAQQLLSTREGVDLTKAFISINDTSMRRLIVALVEEIANRKTLQASGRGRVGR